MEEDKRLRSLAKEGIIPEPFTHAHYSLIRYTENRERLYWIRLSNGVGIGFLKFDSAILLKDTIIYTGPDASQKLLIIRPKRMLPSNALCEILDAVTTERLGFVKRVVKKKSSPTWIIADAYEDTMAEIYDAHRSLLYRLFSRKNASQTYHFFNRGNLLGIYRSEVLAKEERLVHRLRRKARKEEYFSLDFSLDIFDALDRRLAICAAILVAEVDGFPKKS